MSSGSFEWTSGTDEIVNNIGTYGDKVKQAVTAVGNFIAPMMETAAKTNGSWTDRTGNLRQSLQAYVDDTAADIVDIILRNGMDYGANVELIGAGKYAVIWPTIMEYLPQVWEMVMGIVGK